MQTQFPHFPDELQRASIGGCEIERCADWSRTFIVRTPSADSSAPTSAACCLSTPTPVDPTCTLYYFEAELLSAGSPSHRPLDVVIGVARDSLSDTLDMKLPGEAPGSTGFFGTQGIVYAGGTEMTIGGSLPQAQVVGDVVGCLVDFVHSSISFTLNGELLPGSVPATARYGLFPCVGWQRHRSGCSLRVALLDSLPTESGNLLGTSLDKFRFDFRRYVHQFALRAVLPSPALSGATSVLANDNLNFSRVDEASRLALRQYFASRGLSAALAAFEQEEAQLRTTSHRVPPRGGREDAGGLEPTPEQQGSSEASQKPPGEGEDVSSRGVLERRVASLMQDVRCRIVENGDYDGAMQRLAAEGWLEPRIPPTATTASPASAATGSFGIFDTRLDLLFRLKGASHVERLLEDIIRAARAPATCSSSLLDAIAVCIAEIDRELLESFSALDEIPSSGSGSLSGFQPCADKRQRQRFVRELLTAAACCASCAPIEALGSSASSGAAVWGAPLDVLRAFRRASFQAVVLAVEDALLPAHAVAGTERRGAEDVVNSESSSSSSISSPRPTAATLCDASSHLQTEGFRSSARPHPPPRQGISLRTAWRDVHTATALHPVLRVVSSVLGGLLTTLQTPRLTGGQEVAMKEAASALDEAKGGGKNEGSETADTGEQFLVGHSSTLSRKRVRSTALERVFFVASSTGQEVDEEGDVDVDILDKSEMLGWPSASFYFRRSFSLLFGY